MLDSLSSESENVFVPAESNSAQSVLRGDPTFITSPQPGPMPDKCHLPVDADLAVILSSQAKSGVVEESEACAEGSCDKDATPSIVATHPMEPPSQGGNDESDSDLTVSPGSILTVSDDSDDDNIDPFVSNEDDPLMESETLLADIALGDSENLGGNK